MLPKILCHRLTDSSAQHRKVFDARHGSHPGYLGMLGGSGGCVAARNSAVRPRKIASIRDTNSARPPPRQESLVILEHFVVSDRTSSACVTVSLLFAYTCTDFDQINQIVNANNITRRSN